MTRSRSRAKQPDTTPSAEDNVQALLARMHDAEDQNRADFVSWSDAKIPFWLIFPLKRYQTITEDFRGHTFTKILPDVIYKIDSTNGTLVKKYVKKSLPVTAVGLERINELAANNPDHTWAFYSEHELINTASGNRFNKVTISSTSVDPARFPRAPETPPPA